MTNISLGDEETTEFSVALYGGLDTTRAKEVKDVQVVHEDVTSYHCNQDQILLDLAKTEVRNQTIKKRHNEELVIAQKKLKEVEEAAKISASRKSSIKEYRQALEAIEKSFEECCLKGKIEDGTDLKGILSKQQDLQKSVAKHLNDLEASITSEDKNDVAVLPTLLEGSQMSREHRASLVSQGISPRSTNVELLRSRIETLSKGLAKAMPIFTLPQKLNSKSVQREWPIIELDADHQQLLLPDNIAYTDSIMNTILQKLLQSYDGNKEGTGKRSHSFLPVEIFTYFLNGTNYNVGDGMLDPLNFAQSTKDLFCKEDLYFTATIEGRRCSAVLRNIPAALLRRRETLVVAEQDVNQQYLVTDANVRFHRDCVLIIFDPSHRGEGIRTPPSSHVAIKTAITKYILLEAQLNFGSNAYRDEGDIEIKIHTVALPSVLGNKVNNDGPVCLKYLQLYLNDTEKCCKEVFPKKDPADAFWGAYRANLFRQDLIMLFTLRPYLEIILGDTEPAIKNHILALSAACILKPPPSIADPVYAPSLLPDGPPGYPHVPEHLIKYMSINVMKPYQGLSLEGLRLRDYQQGRKSGQGAPTRQNTMVNLALPLAVFLDNPSS